MTVPQQIFDLDLLSRHRTRIAASATSHDFLLQHVADDLAERLSIVRRAFPTALDLGAHHGLLGRRLAATPGIETMISLEPCDLLLALCDPPRMQASLEALPLAPASLDLIVSALSLQFVNDLPGTLLQVRRALRPDGLFLGALLGGETLTELRQAWLIAETQITGGASPRVAPSVDVRELGSLVQRAGFSLPVVDAHKLTVTYASPLTLMQELKAMGASNMLTDRRRLPVTRTLLMRAATIYSDRFALSDGRVPATFEILTITAWCPDPSQPKPLKPGTAQVSLKDVLQPPPRHGRA